MATPLTEATFEGGLCLTVELGDSELPDDEDLLVDPTEINHFLGQGSHIVKAIVRIPSHDRFNFRDEVSDVMSENTIISELYVYLTLVCTISWQWHRS